MTLPAPQPGVIRRQAVRMVSQPAMVDCTVGTPGRPAQPITVVPLLDGDSIAGFEIRCGCGSTAIVECVYAEDSP